MTLTRARKLTLTSNPNPNPNPSPNPNPNPNPNPSPNPKPPPGWSTALRPAERSPRVGEGWRGEPGSAASHGSSGPRPAHGELRGVHSTTAFCVLRRTRRACGGGPRASASRATRMWLQKARERLV